MNRHPLPLIEINCQKSWKGHASDPERIQSSSGLCVIPEATAQPESIRYMKTYDAPLGTMGRYMETCDAPLGTMGRHMKTHDVPLGSILNDL